MYTLDFTVLYQTLDFSLIDDVMNPSTHPSPVTFYINPVLAAVKKKKVTQ